MTGEVFDRVAWGRGVQRAHDLPRTARRVGVAIAVELDETGRLPLTIAALCGVLQLDRWHVSDQLGALVQGGWGRRGQRGAGRGGVRFQAETPALFAANRGVETTLSPANRGAGTTFDLSNRGVETTLSPANRGAGTTFLPPTPPQGLREEGRKGEGAPAGLPAQLALHDDDDVREVFEAAIAAGLVPPSRRDRGALLQAIAGRIDEGCHPADLIAVFRATFDPAGGAVRIPARLWLMKTELVRPRRTAIAPAFVEPIAPAEPDAVGGYAATARANLRAVSR